MHSTAYTTSAAIITSAFAKAVIVSELQFVLVCSPHPRYPCLCNNIYRSKESTSRLITTYSFAYRTDNVWINPSFLQPLFIAQYIVRHVV